jgi:type IV pilus assembly protein PilC
MLSTLQQRVEQGETFSSALQEYPHVFPDVMVSQIRASEKAGTVADTLSRVAEQVETANRTRSKVIRQLSYPAVLVGAGSLAVTFMLVFVIPVFEETYAEAKVPLPMITRTLMAAGRFTVTYGWIVPVLAVAAFVAIRNARKQPAFAVKMDRAVLRVPLVGDWLRNMAVLQFITVFGNLCQSGFRLVDALEVSADAIRNRAMRQVVQRLQAAVTRGERIGRELSEMDGVFPPVVSQLIAVGEKTGSLSKATAYIRVHLEREIDRQTTALVGAIEPILTISLAAAVAVILLAIYLPMFDMIGAVGGAGG